MKKKFLTLVIGLAIAVLLLFSLAACNPPEEDEPMGTQIPFEEVVFGGNFVGLNGDEEFSAIIRSQQELTVFFNGHNVNWASDTPIWERFDGEFFESKALLLHFFWATSTDFTFSVEDVRINNAELKLYLIGSYYGDTLNDAVQFAATVVEVNKSDITDVTDFEVSVRYRKLAG